MSRSDFPAPNDVSIVIPVYNKLALTRACLDSLRATATANLAEIIVVDNGSTDGTASFLASEAESGRLEAVFNVENCGFARACNQGAGKASGRVLFFLNNDTVAHPGWLEPLLRILRLDQEVGAVGSKLLFPDGSVQHAGVIILRKDTPEGATLSGIHVGHREAADRPELNQLKEFQALTAAALMIRREAFEQVGGFDEEYWNGNEDIDLCLKLKRTGWRLVYQPQSVMTHFESQSGPERWKQVDQNVALLTRRWLGKVQPDFEIDRDGELAPCREKVVGIYVQPRLRFEQVIMPCPAGVEPRAAVIVLTHNALEYTRQCVASLLNHTDPRHELIFVDNASSDGTPGYLRELAASHPRCRIILNERNLGFAAGNNIGLATATAEHLVLLNSDVVVTADWLEGLLNTACRHPRAGLIGPVTNNISGLQKLPRVAYNVRTLAGLDAFARQVAAAEQGRTEQVLRLVGFCLLIRRELLMRIGGLDERFGRGNFEDNDYCLRSFLAGYQNLVAHDCFVHHFGSRSYAAAKVDYSAELTDKWEIFKQKWGVPQKIAYNEPYDVKDILIRGFHPVLHYEALPDTEGVAPVSPAEFELEGWLADGEGFYANERFRDAEAIFRHLLCWQPRNGRAGNNLAVSLWQQQRHAGAISALEELLASQPENADARWNLVEFRKQQAGEVRARDGA